MGELLFIATTIFVAYVLFVVMAEKKDGSASAKTEESHAEPERTEKHEPPVEVKTAAAPVKAVAERKPTRAKSASAKKTAAVKTQEPPQSSEPAKTPESAAEPVAAVGDSVKNPKTGEISKLPANYTFIKRWVKDALVEEGLLDKVYKSNELNDDTQVKIQNAIMQLKEMDKYKA